MRVRRAEQCEQGVADELVDEAAELLHRGGEFFEQLVLKRLHDLGVELFGEGRETAEVREQDCDGAPVGLARKGRGGGRGGSRGGPERLRRSGGRRRRSWWRLNRLGRCTLSSAHILGRTRNRAGRHSRSQRSGRAGARRISGKTQTLPE